LLPFGNFTTNTLIRFYQCYTKSSTTMTSQDIFSLQGKVAIVTGASKGIGEAIAQYLASYGAKVVVSSRKQADIELVAQQIRDAGNEAIAIACHTGSPQQCQQLIAQTIQAYGGIDILVNNAATNPTFGPVLNCDGAVFDKIMEINVKAPFELAKMAHPSMKSRGGGSIINISSVSADTPDPGLGIYSVSKASLNMLTKVLAKEWGQDGIRVNTIAPGLIKTKFSEALWKDEQIYKRLTKNLPVGRIGTPNEIASLALYLASEAAAYCTGATFTADGGMTI
jgi:NAD(P)-dependent dehydrogenase (short-subunit alcohol dehydrogenase family)